MLRVVLQAYVKKNNFLDNDFNLQLLIIIAFINISSA